MDQYTQQTQLLPILNITQREDSKHYHVYLMVAVVGGQEGRVKKNEKTQCYLSLLRNVCDPGFLHVDAEISLLLIFGLLPVHVSFPEELSML